MNHHNAPEINLKNIKPLLNQYDLIPKKKLGQNFLIDNNIANKIAKLAGPIEEYVIIEIGAGPGGLTRALINNNAKHIIAVENDIRCIPILNEFSRAFPNKVTVINTNALKNDITKLTSCPYKVISNLPYNIASKLLIKWIPPSLNAAGYTLTFQKEVAERITAKPGNRSYGRLSIISQWCCETNIKMILPPEVFYPTPKVHSAVVNFTPRQQPIAQANFKTLEIITRAAFGQRRKMLKSSLFKLGFTKKIINSVGISETSRPEDLSVEDFCILSKILDEQNNQFTSKKLG